MHIRADNPLNVMCHLTLGKLKVVFPCLELGLPAPSAPKEVEQGGRSSSGSGKKGKHPQSSPQAPFLDCSLCGKVFSSTSSLSKHYVTHSQERKHVCKICSKAFKRQDHLYVSVCQ